MSQLRVFRSVASLLTLAAGSLSAQPQEGASPAITLVLVDSLPHSEQVALLTVSSRRSTANILEVKTGALRPELIFVALKSAQVTVKRHGESTRQLSTVEFRDGTHLPPVPADSRGEIDDIVDRLRKAQPRPVENLGRHPAITIPIPK